MAHPGYRRRHDNARRMVLLMGQLFKQLQGAPMCDATFFGPASSKLESDNPRLKLSIFPILLVLAGAACSGTAGDPAGDKPGLTLLTRAAPSDWKTLTDGSIQLFDGRLIPPLPELLGVREQYDFRVTWLEKKHGHLLTMMRQNGVGAWIIINHEFNDDPATEHVAPDLVYVSRRDLHVFVDAGDTGLARFSSYGRPNIDHARLFEPLPAVESVTGGGDVGARLKAIIDRYQPATIALNMGGDRGHNSALTHDAYQFIVKALGPEKEKLLISSRELIEEYFDTRLPEELEHYRQLVLATDVLAQRALSNIVITPGATTASDLKWWFNQQIADLGVGSEPWFEIHTVVQRFEPETGMAIPYVHPAPDDLVYQQGDVIHLDTGFNYLGFASDWQKVAYVLRDGEDDVPEGLKVALYNAGVAQQAMLMGPRPGMTGREATIATIELLDDVDFLPSLYSHAIGHHGHALGPSINARNMVLGPAPGVYGGGNPAYDSVLRLGSYRSIELSATTPVPEWNGSALTIPFEDDAHLTDEGYVLFRPPQTSWYLIR